jgi:hypothetical protein
MKMAANVTPDDAGNSTIGISGKDFPVIGPKIGFVAHT